MILNLNSEDKFCYLCAQSLSHRQLCDPMDYSPPVASVHEILWQEYWGGLPFPIPGDLPDPGIKPVSPVFLALAGGFFTTVPPGTPRRDVNLPPFGYSPKDSKLVITTK